MFRKLQVSQSQCLTVQNLVWIIWHTTCKCSKVCSEACWRSGEDSRWSWSSWKFGFHYHPFPHAWHCLNWLQTRLVHVHGQSCTSHYFQPLNSWSLRALLCDLYAKPLVHPSSLLELMTTINKTFPHVNSGSISHVICLLLCDHCHRQQPWQLHSSSRWSWRLTLLITRSRASQRLLSLCFSVPRRTSWCWMAPAATHSSNVWNLEQLTWYVIKRTWKSWLHDTLASACCARGCHLGALQIDQGTAVEAVIPLVPLHMEMLFSSSAPLAHPRPWLCCLVWHRCHPVFYVCCSPNRLCKNLSTNTKHFQLHVRASSLLPFTNAIHKETYRMKGMLMMAQQSIVDLHVLHLVLLQCKVWVYVMHTFDWTFVYAVGNIHMQSAYDLDDPNGTSLAVQLLGEQDDEEEEKEDFCLKGGDEVCYASHLKARALEDSTVFTHLWRR